MRLAVRLAAVLGLLAGVRSTFAEPSSDLPLLHFEPSLAAAFERAKSEKIPVLVCVMMEGEPGCDAVIAGPYHDKELAEIAAHAACVVGCVKPHGETTAKAADGASRKVCDRFGSLTCAEHLAIDVEVRSRWLKTETVIAPQHLLIDPTGKELLRKAYQVDAAQLKKMVQVARYLVDSASVEKGGIEKELKAAQDVYNSALSKNQATRKPAIQTLSTYEDPRAFKLLADLATAKGDDMIRQEAIYAMGQKGSYRALPVLLECMKDKSVGIREGAVVSIQELRLPDAVAPLLKLYKAETSDRVQGRILRAAARSDPKNADVEALALREAGGKSTLLQMHAAIALAYLPASPKVLEALRKLASADASSSNLRGLAVWALGMQRDAGSSELLAKIAASDKVNEVRTTAEGALKAIKDGPDPDFEGAYERFVGEDHQMH